MVAPLSGIDSPASTTHSFVSPEARAAAGMGEGMVQLSVGIEHPEDLLMDLKQALECCAKCSHRSDSDG